ncbi:mandelate racemase/muconate lactonizing enzyme family protein [Chloroflexota bacterium]
MKINRVEIIPQDIPQRTAFRTSTGAITSGNFVILKIQTDEGVEGVGSSSGFGTGGQNRESAMIIMKNIASQALLGQDPLNTDLLLNRVETLLGENIIGDNSRIMAHFDYALYDLKGKILNVPVYQLLGGLSREKIPLEWIIVMDEPEAQAEIALKYINAGFHSLKVHVGTEPKMAVKRFKTIREAVGPEIPIGIDIAGAWRANDALRLIEELVQYDISFAEDPALPLDIDGFVAVKRGTNVPLIADRDARSVIEAHNLIKQGAADIFHCLLDKVGGIRVALKYSALIEAAGLDYAICVMGAGISHAAGAHFAVSRVKKPGVHDEIGLALYIHGATETEGITTDVTKELSGKIEKGYLYPPKGPGLGVELNEENVERYATPGVSKLVVK